MASSGVSQSTCTLRCQASAALVYGSSESLAERGWRGPFGTSSFVEDKERIPLNVGGQRFRYYLIWITTLPPNMQSASIAELTLFR